jgi:energy-converting hydrogenase Eha subunit G
MVSTLNLSPLGKAEVEECKIAGADPNQVEIQGAMHLIIATLTIVSHTIIIGPVGRASLAGEVVVVPQEVVDLQGVVAVAEVLTLSSF